MCVRSYNDVQKQIFYFIFLNGTKKKEKKKS